MFTVSRRKRILAFLVIASLLSIGSVTIFISMKSDATAEIGYWPPLTTVYETDGPSWNGTIIGEVHRLEYVSVTEWTDTVIESDPIESIADGTIYTVGSYSLLSGSKYEEYDSTSGETSVEEIAEDSIFVPNLFLMPFHVSEFKKTRGGDLFQAETVSKVCYQGDCEQNSGGISHYRGEVEWTYADESRWGIPLKVGDAFLVREVQIDRPKE
ncbi:MAG: hypothetical protein QF898_11430 [SAR202 cluster bacterium]|nr:hypothetical protein [SAR202 cluster bacterium]MDP6513675.1 hypothetical protein [SAR202 cluster bacterium]MDP6712997.1 hypothetical protein [SAR202 cluster bacterium]